MNHKLKHNASRFCYTLDQSDSALVSSKLLLYSTQTTHETGSSDNCSTKFKNLQLMPQTSNEQPLAYNH